MLELGLAGQYLSWGSLVVLLLMLLTMQPATGSGCQAGGAVCVARELLRGLCERDPATSYEGHAKLLPTVTTVQA